MGIGETYDQLIPEQQNKNNIEKPVKNLYLSSYLQLTGSQDKLANIKGSMRKVKILSKRI